ncbi:MAG: trypsin-like peptidase domain-containing protein, partial [Spirochaetales bacterium]|nr:trypsin-like peptidase domain-containing protein [Spirochaetales bacterium]
MVIRKMIYTIIILSTICYFTYADLKDYVGIVKPQIHEKTTKLFMNIADYFEKSSLENKDILASIFRSFAKSGFGSCFIITDKEGNNFIITNNHVVKQAEKVSIEFEKPDGTKKVYSDCPILYSDNDIDIAVLQFPDKEKVLKRGLDLDESMLADGSEVWSAGFPGLLGRPSWQFAKGNVTNHKAFIPEMVDPSISHVIQHSASIDPGNSGGPLLVKDEKSVAGFKVVGINTWSVNDRQNTFFSLPSININKILEEAKIAEALKSDEKQLKEALLKTCKILAAELGSSNPDLERVNRFISYTFVGESGWDSFLAVLNASDKTQAAEWENYFFNYSPIEAMRAAIYTLFWYNLKKNENLSQIEYDSINFADEDKIMKLKDIRTNFKIKDEKIEIIWSYELGHWLITKMELSPIAESSTQTTNTTGPNDDGKKTKNPCRHSITVGVGGLYTPGYLGDTYNIPYNQNLLNVHLSLSYYFLLFNDNTGYLGLGLQTKGFYVLSTDHAPSEPDIFYPNI